MATMLRWNERQRGVLIDKLADTANIAAGGLVFGQAFGQSISLATVVAGISMWVVLLGWSMFLGRRKQR